MSTQPIPPQVNVPSLSARVIERYLTHEELADFLDNASVGLHCVGADGRILWADKTEMTLLGFGPEEYIGRHVAEFHVEPDVSAQILDRLARNETLHNYEARLRAKDGSIKHVLISSNVMWEDGRFIHTRCFTRDITDHKHAEEVLRCREEQLAATLRVARVGVWEWDIQTGRVLWSATLEEIHGLTPGTFDGTFEAFLKDVHPDDREMITQRIQHAIQGGGEYGVEYRLSPVHSSDRWVEAKGQVRYDDTHEPVMMHGICMDISARKQVELELQGVVSDLKESKRALQEKIQDLELFHDLVVDRELKMIEQEKEIERLRALLPSQSG
jgi:PAS domain S-box-containing protein